MNATISSVHVTMAQLVGLAFLLAALPILLRALRRRLSWMPRFSDGGRASRAAEYRKYLKSPEWKALRRQAMERDGHRCRTCNAERNLEAHHRYYPEEFGTETIDALTTLCRSCHELFETRRRRR